MKYETPFPDHFFDGDIVLNDQHHLRPGDTVYLRDTDGGLMEVYELLSVRADDSVMVDTMDAGPQHLSQEAFEEVLDSGTPYVWTILSRAMVPIENAVNKSLVLSTYMFSHQFTPNDIMMIGLDWAVTNQNPVTTMTESDGLVVSPRFSELREALRTDQPNDSVVASDDDLARLRDGFDGTVLSDVVDDALDVAELNAEKMFVFDGESKFTEEEAQESGNQVFSTKSSIKATSPSYQ